MSAVLSADVSRGASVTRVTARLHEPPDFPVSASVPKLPISIPEEILDYYAFVFCQFGFGQMNMTFEQFLLVVSAVSSAGLHAEFE
jgi:hypothetical protein